MLTSRNGLPVSGNVYAPFSAELSTAGRLAARAPESSVTVCQEQVRFPAACREVWSVILRTKAEVSPIGGPDVVVSVHFAVVGVHVPPLLLRLTRECGTA